jgi:hypothetical protein
VTLQSLKIRKTIDASGEPRYGIMNENYIQKKGKIEVKPYRSVGFSKVCYN